MGTNLQILKAKAQQGSARTSPHYFPIQLLSTDRKKQPLEDLNAFGFDYLCVETGNREAETDVLALRLTGKRVSF